jgi:FtsP/CotA-like multicopper oxidase with cupredoxin domain
MLPMRRYLALIALSLAAAPAAAQDWRQAREYEVIVSSYDIAPSQIRLDARRPVRLRLINQSGQSHILRAPGFFGAARVRRRDQGAVADGRVTVGPGETRELLLVPAPGRYTLRSGNFLYRMLGMSGEIVVE